MQSCHLHPWGSYLGKGWFPDLTLWWGLVSRRCTSPVEESWHFYGLLRCLRIHWQMECEISLGPLCLMCCMKYGRIGPFSISWDGKWNVNQDIPTQAPYFRFSLDGTPTKAKRNLEEDRFPYPNFGRLCHIRQSIHMRGPREQRVLLMKALPAVYKEETPWDFLRGSLPWLHRYHQGHQNISTFTCSLFPNSEFGSFMIKPIGFVSLKLDLGLFFSFTWQYPFFYVCVSLGLTQIIPSPKTVECCHWETPWLL